MQHDARFLLRDYVGGRVALLLEVPFGPIMHGLVSLSSSSSYLFTIPELNTNTEIKQRKEVKAWKATREATAH